MRCNIHPQEYQHSDKLLSIKHTFISLPKEKLDICIHKTKYTECRADDHALSVITCMITVMVKTKKEIKVQCILKTEYRSITKRTHVRKNVTMEVRLAQRIFDINIV